MATKAELRNKVLQKLGIIDATETPRSEDQTLVEDAYDAVYQELRSRHLVDWGSTEDIPTWAVLHVRDLVANRVTNEYGLPRSLDEELIAFKAMAKHLASDYHGQPTEATYF